MSSNNELQAESTVIVYNIAPKIFETAVSKQIGNYNRRRHTIDKYYHWMSPSKIDPAEDLVIHGALDRQELTLRDSIRVLFIGVVSLNAMSAVWLRMDKPQPFLHTKSRTLNKAPGVLLSDPLTDYLTEQFALVGASDGELVTDEAKLARISEYSEFLTVLEMHGGEFEP